MDINSVISIIPNIIASLYEAIYVIDANNYHEIKYNGEELMVSIPNELNKLKDLFNDYKEDITPYLDEKNLKKVFKTKDGFEKLIIITTIEDYKLLLIMDAAKRVIADETSAKILVADDSMIVRNFFTKTMSDKYEVLVANDGSEAIDLLEIYKDSNLQAAFIDLNMPNKNGYEVLTYMKENNLLEKVPVSVISGEDEKENIERVIEMGAVDMLQKPFDNEATKAIVEKTIQKHKSNT